MRHPSSTGRVLDGKIWRRMGYMRDMDVTSGNHGYLSVASNMASVSVIEVASRNYLTENGWKRILGL